LKRLEKLETAANTQKVRTRVVTPKGYVPPTAAEMDAWLEEIVREHHTEWMLERSLAGHLYRVIWFDQQDSTHPRETETETEKTARTKAWFFSQKNREVEKVVDEIQAANVPVVGWGIEMSKKLIGRKLTLPEFQKPDVPPSSAHYNRAVRESVWEWENQVLALVDFESAVEQRLFFSYACGRTEGMAAIHKDNFVAAVPLDELYSRIQNNWQLIDIPANHTELVLTAAVTPSGYRKRGGESIPYKGSIDYAEKMGKVMSKNYIKDNGVYTDG